MRPISRRASTAASASASVMHSSGVRDVRGGDGWVGGEAVDGRVAELVALSSEVLDVARLG